MILKKNETRSMRSKEEANDYRYFPDPDLLPVEVMQSDLDTIRSELPELPWIRRQRFIDEYSLSEYDSTNLTANRDIADYFETTVKLAEAEPKLCANWVMGDLSANLNKHSIDIKDSPVSASMLGGMLKRINDSTISSKIAKQVFEDMWNGEGDADIIIQAKGLKQVTDIAAIERLVEEVIADSGPQVAQYQAAEDDKKGKLLGYFVGQIMKLSQGKANPKQVNELLRKKTGIIKIKGSVSMILAVR